MTLYADVSYLNKHVHIGSWLVMLSNCQSNSTFFVIMLGMQNHMDFCEEYFISKVIERSNNLQCLKLQATMIYWSREIFMRINNA